MLPKPVPFVQEVSSAVGDAVIQSKEVSAIVVLEDAAADGGHESGWEIKRRQGFGQRALDW